MPLSPVIIPAVSSPIGWSDPFRSSVQPNQSRYCQPWDNNPDGPCKAIVFQLEFRKVGYDILEGNALVPYYTGNTTAVGVDQLIDSGAAFAAPPVLSAHIVVNNTDTTQSTATGTVSATSIDTNDDIFGAGTSGDAYAVVALRLPVGNVLYNGYTDSLRFSPFVGSNSVIIEDAFPNTTNRFVVEVDIEDYFGGDLTIVAGSYPVTFSVFDNTISGAKGNGTFSFYGVPSGVDLQLLDTSTESNYVITGVRVYYIARPEVVVYDGPTVIQVDTPNSYIHNFVSVTKLNPCDYADGCYQLYANNVNGLVGSVNFPQQSPPSWTITNLGTGWAFVANELVHTSGGGVGTNKASYKIYDTTSKDCNYVIFFSLDAAGDKPSVFIKLIDGTFVDVSAYISATAGPNYYINITGYNFLAVEFRGTEIDNITIESFNIYDTYYNQIGGYFTPSGNSEVAAFRIAPTFCTPVAELCVKDLGDEYILFRSEITNTGDIPAKKSGRWITAGATYTESLYVRSNVRFARYQDEDYDIYRNALGDGVVVYSDRVEVYECQVAAAPQWLHSWMSWAVRNAFTINGKAFYAPSGEYSPSWSRRSPDASAVFDVIEQSQNTKTTLC